MKNINQSKEANVTKVFDDVFNKYDLMNDIMSFGAHRVWKNKLIDWMNPNKNDHAIDIASGTGDVAKAFLKRTDFNGIVKYYGCDTRWNKYITAIYVSTTISV